MKKVFSMFLILIMILPLLPVNAQDSSCLIEFDSAQPSYSMSGTHAFISGHHNDGAITASHNGTTGWVLNPTSDKSDAGYGYHTLFINLPDSFMNNLPGTQDVLVDICYYDGLSSDKGNKFCVFYDSQDHYYETAGIVTLAGSGEWKTHTFVLEKPRLHDIGEYPTMNIGISVTSSYMGTSKGNVTIASAEICYGEERDLFLTLDSENVGNIFFGSDSVNLKMDLENPYAVNHGDLTVKFTITDKYNGSTYKTEKTVSVGDSMSLADSVSFDDLSLPFGIYNVTADIYSGETLVVSDTTEISRVSSKLDNEPANEDGVNNPFFGINTHAVWFNEEQTVTDLLYLAEKLGAGYVRINFSWDDFEKTAGEYVIPENARLFIEEANKRNLRVMVMLGNDNLAAYPGCPGWRAGSTEENFQTFLEAYSNFVKYIVSELGDAVECWEIFNEYTLDYPGYDKNSDEIANEAAADYADILKAGYNAVKEIAPDARIVGGAIDVTGQYDNHAGVLYREYNAGAYMNALSYHFYAFNNSDQIDSLNNRTDRLKGYITEAEADNEIYLSEFNFHSDAYSYYTEEEITIYNAKLFIKERYDGRIDRIYAYNLENGSYSTSKGYGYVLRPEDDYDYLSKTSSARASFAVVSFMNKLLRLSDNIDSEVDDNGNRIYEFYDNINDRPVYAIWNENDAASSVTINKSDTELFAYDMYGNLLNTADDSITVETGVEPVYVTGPEKDFLMGEGNDPYKVTVSGDGTIGNNISIVVLNKGISKEEYNSVNHLLYANQSVVDPGGKWSFTFKITQGNGMYEVLLAEENGEIFTYELEYDAGELRVGYELNQNDRQIKNFASLGDGDLDITYRIDNPENRKSKYTLFACLYKGNNLVDVVKSPDSEFCESDLITTGSISVPAVKKSEIDKVQIMVFTDTDTLCPLVKKFVLE